MRISLLLAAFVLTTAVPAQAAFVAVMQQVGPDIVLIGNGTINLDGLGSPSSNSALAGRNPNTPSVGGGATPGSFIDVDLYDGIVSAPAFGTGSGGPWDQGSGDRVNAIADQLAVYAGYVSNDPLNYENKLLNASFASIGVNPGTYVWSWGSGSNADTFTLQIVPEPTSALFLGCTGALACLRRRRR